MIPTAPCAQTPSPRHPPSQHSAMSYHSSRPSTSSLPRTYKRPKNTPSPSSPLFADYPYPSPSSGQPGPSTSRSRTRTAVARRLVDPSPQQHQSQRRLEGRRREMSVPLLSQELSHFSLSHSSPSKPAHRVNTTPPAVSHTSTSPSRKTRTPRTNGHFGPIRTPFGGALPKDHSYPATAPLPQLSSLLGSPFSGKTTRGRYVYCSASPSQHAQREASNPSGENQFGYSSADYQDLEWLERDEGLPQHDQTRYSALFDSITPLPDGLPNGLVRLRRGTNGSTSSMDELSGSGASTASLLSLARNSIEQHSRPSIITAWDGESPGVTEEDEDEPTPNRQLFTKPLDQHILQSARKDANQVSDSPALAFKLPAQPAMPRSQSTRVLQSLTDNQPHRKSDLNPKAADSGRPRKSPLANLLPRLLSSKKKTPTGTDQNRATGRFTIDLTQDQDDDILTDTEAGSPSSFTYRGKVKNGWQRTKSSASSVSNDERDKHVPLEEGIRVEAESTARPGFDLARSFSSDSSGEVDRSPSRPLSHKGSTSMFATPSVPYSPTSTALLGNASKSTYHARRKSITTGQTLPRPIAESPTSAANRSTSRARPFLRRGLTAPAAQTPSNPSFLSADSAFYTPTAALFGDIKPSPAAFASTGLVKKKSAVHGIEIPRFGTRTDSEPVGEAKRDQAALQHGMTRPLDPPSPISPLRSMKVARPMLSKCWTGGSSGTSASTSTSGNTARSTGILNSNAAYIQHAQKTRGLRRKGSQMFTASGSIGSIDMMRSDSNRSAKGGVSPATPTKHGLQPVAPVGLGITTPSPTHHRVLYPFAASGSLVTPPHVSTTAEPFEPSSIELYRGVPARVRQISDFHQTERRGPVARASNPMLAASYQSVISVVPETPGQDETPSIPHSLFNANASRPDHRRIGGTRLERDFTVIQTLGSGAFSQVLKVREKATNRLYAVKAGKPYTGAKNRLRQLEEVSILRQLSLAPHPNVLEYIDSWETHSRLYIQTQLVECGDLSKFLGLLGDFGGLGEARVWKTLVELASGIDHIHKHNFLHLDIKPSNILINRHGGLVIADLGMAVVCSSDSGTILGGFSPALPGKDDQGEFVWTSAGTDSHGSRVTTPGIGLPEGSFDPERGDAHMEMIPSPILDREVEGDREYLSPEGLSNGQVGKGADVFSLGMVVLESAMNVVLPSNGEGWVKLRNDDYSDLSEHYRARSRVTDPVVMDQDDGVPVDRTIAVISDELIDVIKRMMRSSPAERIRLDDVWGLDVIRRLTGMERGRALVEESDEWLERVLGVRG
ncbi:hypothetical protein IAU60_006455 [Kwoniella sp. DSM 27419]